jgi:hypothetical protein
VRTLKSTTLLIIVSDAGACDAADVYFLWPQKKTRIELADRGFDAPGRLVRVTRLPRCLMWCVVTLVRLFDQRGEELLAFPRPGDVPDPKAPLCGSNALDSRIRGLWGER